MVARPAPRITARPASKLSAGRWTASWGSMVLVVTVQTNTTSAMLYLRDGKMHTGCAVAGADHTVLAVTQMCNAMVEKYKASVVVDGKQRALIDYLAFVPQMTAVE